MDINIELTLVFNVTNMTLALLSLGIFTLIEITPKMVRRRTKGGKK